MDTLHEIEAAVDALPDGAEGIVPSSRGTPSGEGRTETIMPLVPPTGYSIAQQDIDDVFDAN
jgi:hypothetical protein